MSPDTLDQLTDAELSECFAVEVAGWTRVGTQDWRDDKGCYWHGPVDEPPFATSADAVLPWLEKWTKETDSKYGGEPEVFRIYSPAGPHDKWTVVKVWMHHDGDIEEDSTRAATLPRAICIALIRAKRASNGVAP